MRIELLTPIVARGVRSLDDVEPLMGDDLTITHSLLDKGPSSIESRFDEALALPDTIRKAMQAEINGADAIVIDCMGDPGLAACREMVDIPVLGAGQTAMHLANLLGHRFAFITVLDRIRPIIEELIAAYGLGDKYASFQSVDIPVLDLSHDVGALNAGLAEKARLSVEADGADIIVLGCTGFLGCAEAIRGALSAAGHEAPVIDPIPVTVRIAQALVRAGLSHSKAAYPTPAVKPIEGYEFPGSGRVSSDSVRRQ